jgi:hypothetical protein
LSGSPHYRLPRPALRLCRYWYSSRSHGHGLRQPATGRAAGSPFCRQDAPTCNPIPQHPRLGAGPLSPGGGCLLRSRRLAGPPIPILAQTDVPLPASQPPPKGTFIPSPLPRPSTAAHPRLRFPPSPPLPTHHPPHTPTMSTRKRKQEAEDTEELVALPSDESDEEEE